MMSLLHSIVIGGAVVLTTASAVPLMAPTVVRANPPTPDKLWDGFSSPVGMAFDAAGHLYVAEWGAGRVLRIAPDGTRAVFADGLAGPSGLAIGPDGAIYVASYSRGEIYRFTPEGARSLHVTGLATPAGIGFDRTGRLLIANRRTNEILSLTDNGRPTPVIDSLQTPVGAVQTPDGGYVVSNIGGGVTIVRPDGARVEAGAAFRTPGPDVAMTRDGRVFVVDYGGTTVREILPDGRSRTVADGIKSPVGLVLSPDGASLLTAAWSDGTIYRIPIPQ
ncbi:NHL repeat-containing protein [Rhizobium sp. GR12]|uniref:NHL repeat-containing protein n=1 Tax=Rhizobium sp. GR12 TaxID=3053925 RepID=UPI002FBD37A4